MLVLSRKTRETIRIGDQIVVTILRVQGRTIRVGIEAPSNVRVMRGEVAASTKPSSRDEERLAEAEMLYTADGEVAASFEPVEDAEIEPQPQPDEPSQILSMRRIERRFPMRTAAVNKAKSLTAVTAN